MHSCMSRRECVKGGGGDAEGGGGDAEGGGGDAEGGGGGGHGGRQGRGTGGEFRLESSAKSSGDGAVEEMLKSRDSRISTRAYAAEKRGRVAARNWTIRRRAAGSNGPANVYSETWKRRALNSTQALQAVDASSLLCSRQIACQLRPDAKLAHAFAAVFEVPTYELEVIGDR